MADLPNIDNPRYIIKVKVAGRTHRTASLELPREWDEKRALAEFPSFVECALKSAKRGIYASLYHWPSDSIIKTGFYELDSFGTSL